MTDPFSPAVMPLRLGEASAGSGRRRLLFLSQCLPFPPTSGVTNRTFNILRQLAREYDVTLLAFSRARHQPTAEARASARTALARTVAEVAEPVLIPSQHSLGRKLWDHLRSVLSGEAYTYYEYSADAFERQLAALRTRGFDLVHIDSLDLYRWVRGLEGIPIACTHHNVESELLRIRARHLDNPLAARYVSHQAELTERVERRLAPRFDLNLMMSELDEARLHRIAPAARTAVVPNGVDATALQPTPESDQVDGRVLFLGPLYMFPNLDGVEYFVRDIWPLIRERRPGASLQLIGAASDHHQATFNAVPGVECAGFVPDIRPHIAQAQCCIVPLRVGGGTRLKVLDYWGLGKAVVSTTLGAEGLAVRDGENILLRDDPAGTADAVLAVLADRELRRRLGSGARQTAEAIYDWQRIGDGLLREYAALLAQSRSVA